MNEWLSKLKVGDKVILDHGRMNGSSIKTIDKITPTGILVIHGEKFNSNGFPRPHDQWSTRMLREATVKAMNEVRQVNLANKMHTFKWSHVPLKDLRAIHAILQKITE